MVMVCRRQSLYSNDMLKFVQWRSGEDSLQSASLMDSQLEGLRQFI